MNIYGQDAPPFESSVSGPMLSGWGELPMLATYQCPALVALGSQYPK